MQRSRDIFLFCFLAALLMSVQVIAKLMVVPSPFNDNSLLDSEEFQKKVDLKIKQVEKKYFQLINHYQKLRSVTGSNRKDKRNKRKINNGGEKEKKFDESRQTDGKTGTGFTAGDNIPPFTSDICRLYDPNLGFASSYSLSSKADSLLIGNEHEAGIFDHVVKGFSLTILNSTSSIAFGGGLNPKGAYQVFLFDSNQIFPPGFCQSVPSCTHQGGDMSQPMECHPRCNPTQSGDPDYIFSFTLGEADAIVYTSCSPPPMKYFSLDSYISTRTIKGGPLFYPGQNFGDSLNHLRMNISTTKYSFSSSSSSSSQTSLDEEILPDSFKRIKQGKNLENSNLNLFEEPYTIIQSGDNMALEKLKEAYNSVGMPLASINTYGIDGSTVKFLDRSINWEDNEAIDLFINVFRLSLPLERDWEHPNSTFSKYSSMIWPVSLYFAEDNMKSKDPYVPHLLSRYVNPTDGKPLLNQQDVYGPAFTYLKNVANKSFIERGLEYTGARGLDGETPSFYDDWKTVLANQNNDSFTLPTRDALYGMEKNPPLIEKTSSFVLVGALQPTASYHEVMLNSYNVISMKFSFLLTLTDEDLQGTASRYLDGSEYENKGKHLFALDVLPFGKCPNSEKIAGKFYRESACVELPTVHTSKTNIFGLGERVYSLEETTIGAPANMTILMESLAFK